MPMIDVYAAVGTFSDPHRLAVDLASTLMEIEQVPDIPMFRQNTAAFIHEFQRSHLANVEGDGSYVRVQVLTNADALDRDKQLAVVARSPRSSPPLLATPPSPSALGCSSHRPRTAAGGLAGHADTNQELVPPPEHNSPSSTTRRDLKPTERSCRGGLSCSGAVQVGSARGAGGHRDCCVWQLSLIPHRAATLRH